MGSLRIVILVFRGALPSLCRRGEAILNIRLLFLTEQTTHGGGLRRLSTVTALDTMLSLDGRNLPTSSRHLRRICLDTSALVVHAGKHPMSKALTGREMNRIWQCQGSDRATGDRAGGRDTRR